MDLRKLVIAKIKDLGEQDASKWFGVSIGTISNWKLGKTQPSVAAAQAVLAEKMGDEGVKEMPLSDAGNLQEFVWKGKEVMILSPVYKSFHPYTHFTLFANYAKYGPEKIGLLVEGMTLVYEARNILIKKALDTDCKTFIMVDDDMIFPCGNEILFNGKFQAGVSKESASFNLISRLMASGRDKGIVGALYFGRHSKGRAQNSLGFKDNQENDKFRKGLYKGLIPLDWVGTGAIKIERWVLEKMNEAIDAGKWPECKKPREDYWRGPFNPKQAGTGEDVSFCLRAKEIGIQTYLDASLVCLHIGDTIFGPRNTSN